jgi:hypothetical protein
LQAILVSEHSALTLQSLSTSRKRAVRAGGKVGALKAAKCELGVWQARMAPADLNGRNLSALYEIVDGWNRNPQVLSRLFYGKQIVN